MKKEQNNAVVLSEEDKYRILHQEIVQYGNMATSSFVQFMAKLKEMRDGKLYQAVGIESFAEYVEQQVGIKERQAYNYISAYESYSKEFLHSNAKIGITKLLLLAPLEEGDRQQIMEEVDVESTSVRELKQIIEKKDKEIAQLQSDYDTLYTDADSVRAERDELQEKADSLEKEKADWQKDTDNTKKLTEQLQKNEQEKQKLLQEIDALKNAPAKVETVDNPETVKALEAAQNQIKELETKSAELNKRLELANDETMSKFKSKFDDFQLIGQDILHLLSAMDDEKATKCKAALKAVVGGWQL